MSTAQTLPPETTDRLEELEHRLTAAWQRLGMHREPPPSKVDRDARSVELHLQWVEKELRGLRRLAADRAAREAGHRTLGQWLRDLHPRVFTARLAQLGLGDAPADVDAQGASVQAWQRVRPWLRFLFEEYFRAEVEGIGNVPTLGPALLVGNHGGLLPFDALMLRYAVEELHPAGRAPRILIEDWFMELPVLNLLLTRLGAMRGSQQNARRLLADGDLVTLFPEGAKGVTKRWRDRYRVQRFGRGGTIRLALETGVPIIPVAIVGGEEIYPLLARLRLPIAGAEFNFLPLTPTFPWLGPLGLLPLPGKWMIRFGAPLDLQGLGKEAAGDEIAVNELNETLRSTIQDMVNGLLQQRRSPWLG